MKTFREFKSILESYVKNVSEDLEKDDDDPCWDGYVQLGTKMKDGKEVPNCVPIEEAYQSIDETKLYKVFGVKDDGKEEYVDTISSPQGGKSAHNKMKKDGKYNKIIVRDVFGNKVMDRKL